MSNNSTSSISSDEDQCITLNLFRLAIVEKYYIGMRDWGPFTIPVYPYFLELVWELYASYKNKTEVPIDVAILIACIMDHVYINVGKIITDQFKRRAKQQATSLPYPSLVSMLRVRASCPLFQPLDKTVWDEGVITLATKTNRDSPAIKQAKGIENNTQPPPSMSSSTPGGQLQAAEQAIRKAMQPARDKLRGLCTTVEVLENEVISFRKDVATLIGPPPTSNPTPPEPMAVTSQPEAPKSPPDD
ncbi:hypothetical protein HAX54_042920 [Datura stramonium]|uniref:Aminotransferase-like plant mobile domain-containing protein n=1 Tax=Datura stramonium TaxID=4076 RepID=A0ABS8W0M1_DATST|nr:hypothetical protein [Datura stramonium]